ncbi:MAG: response regulator transcription factor [Herminiimonas sp.]|uniref:response regulator transcription factor n=1 Tax=Herminiimonas sp. TaxID=1926289 RepID=UPI00271C7B5F|nr:response regulator transcription factor [Herminiimonas sp.]MDO9419724.1 response regulator transcription factor [Herminiimonas sp.]
MKIAVLEDDAVEAQLIQRILTRAGHICTGFSTGASLLKNLKTDAYDLLLLDWALPDMTGYDVLNWVRTNLGPEIIVLFLSNHDLEENIVASLMAGGDDYLVKPARSAELLARIHSMSRRLSGSTTPADNGLLEVGAYRLDKILKTAEVHGVAIELKPKEFNIALLLLQNAGAIVSRETLMEEVWGRELVTTSRTLDTHISQVRRKLMFSPENKIKLSTVYSLGYRLDLL